MSKYCITIIGSENNCKRDWMKSVYLVFNHCFLLYQKCWCTLLLVGITLVFHPFLHTQLVTMDTTCWSREACVGSMCDWVMGCEASYVHISLCFRLVSRDINSLFHNTAHSLLATLSYFARTMDLSSPLRLST